MSLSSFIFAVCLVVGAGADLAFVTEDEGVLVLNEANFDQVVNSSQLILVMFYSDGCGHCKKFAPEFVEAVSLMAKTHPQVKLAKVGTGFDTNIFKRFNIRGVPTLMLFKNGLAGRFNGERNAESLVEWTGRMLQPLETPLKSAEEARKFVGSADVAVVGFFKDSASPGVKEFKDAAFRSFNDLPIGLTDDANAFAAFGVSQDSIVVFQNVDGERPALTAPFSVEEAADFVTFNRYALIADDRDRDRLRGGKPLAFLVHVDSPDSPADAWLRRMRPAAERLRGRVRFVSVDVTKSPKRLVGLGVDTDELPTVVMKMNSGLNYKMTFTEVTPDAVVDFAERVMECRKAPFFRSQPLPSDWRDSAVRTLNADNFNREARAKTVNSLVVFCAPDHPICRPYEELWPAVAEKFVGDPRQIFVGYVNLMFNDIEDYRPVRLPDIRFYPANSFKEFEFEEEPQLEKIVQFVNEKAEKPITRKQVDKDEL